jgi:hypothetical protein
MKWSEQAFKALTNTKCSYKVRSKRPIRDLTNINPTVFFLADEESLEPPQKWVKLRTKDTEGFKLLIERNDKIVRGI